MESNTTQLTNICQYHVKPGREAEMERLLARHWPALHAAGLAADEPSVIYRGLPSDEPGGEHGAQSSYLEILTWKTKEGPALAHQSPDVMAVWEPMGAICEKMDFPAYERIDPNS